MTNNALASGGDFGPTWPEVVPPPKAPLRELTRPERTAIRKLVTDMCANYDRAHGCLILECSCYMLNKYWTDANCKYFQRGVLPLDPMLEAALLNQAIETRTCAVCGKPYIPDGKQVYCGAVCADNARRKQNRERMRKRRSV